MTRRGSSDSTMFATGSPAARIKTFETAFGMQREAPAVFDLSQETDETLDLYGLSRGQTTGFGWQCLIARRLVERGVRSPSGGARPAGPSDGSS